MARRRPTPEKAFQTKLVDALHARGYIVDHTYQLRTDDGSWRTGSTLKGKPDLICLRPPWQVAIEVKADGGRLRPDQQAVLSYYAGIHNARAWVLDPTVSWESIMAWIDDLAAAPRVYGFDPMPILDAYRILATASQRKAR